MTAKKPAKPRTTAPKPPPEVMAIFEEAKQKAAERNGIVVGLAGYRFPLWMSRFTYKERQRIERHCGMGPFDVAINLGSSAGHIELIAAIVAMSVYQTEGKLPDMDGVVAFVEGAVLGGDVPTVDALEFDAAIDPQETEGND